MATSQAENPSLDVKMIAIVAAVVIAILIAVFSIGHAVRQNSPQVVSVMHVQPGSFGKGAWMKAHHMGAWANSNASTTAAASSPTLTTGQSPQ